MSDETATLSRTVNEPIAIGLHVLRGHPPQFGEKRAGAQIDDRWGYARRSPQCKGVSPIPVAVVVAIHSEGKVSPLPHTNHTLKLIAITVLGGTLGAVPQF